MVPIAYKFLPLTLTLLLAYFLLEIMGSFFAVPGQAAMVWPAAGVGIAAVLLLGLRGLLVPLLGTLAMRFIYRGEGFQNFPFYLMPAVGEAFVGWALLRWWVGKRFPILRSKDATLFFSAAFASSLVGAILGVGFSFGGPGGLNGGLSWFLADFVGILVITPAFLMVFGLSLRRWWPGLKRGGLLILLGIGGFQIVGYSLEGFVGSLPFSWEFLALPAVFLSVWFFRTPGMVVANLCLYGGTMWHFFLGGPLQPGDSHFSLTQVQAFLVLVGGMSLVLNGFLQEQGVLRRAAEQSSKRLQATLRRLEQELDREVSLLRERMELKDALRKSKRAEALGKRAGSVIHDYSNMMTALIGHVEQAKRFVGRGENPEEAFEVLSNGLYQAEILGRRILVDSDEDSIQVTSLPVGEIVQEVFKLWKVLLPPGVVAEISIQEDLPPALGDPVWLRQAVLNLLRNAKDALGPRGKIRVQVFVQEAPLEPGEGCWSFGQSSRYLCILVLDDGAGMDANLRERVLEPFFSTKGEGHGFGLSSVIQGVEHLGGAMRIESAPGEGTQVFLFLPLDEAVHLIPTVPPVSKGAVTFSKKHRILVIEDDPHLARIYQRVLGEAGCEVKLAHNWEEGKELLRAEDLGFSLVLLDWSLPDAHGSEVMDDLRATNPNLPILLVSGYREDELRSHLKGAPESFGGSLGFLAKPFRPAKLLALIAELVEGEEPAPRGQ